MPRAEHGDGGGYVLPGVYRTLLDKDCERGAGPDPRLYLEMDAEDWEQMKARGRAAADQLLAERLEAGEPLVVPRWRIGGHSIPVPKDVVQRDGQRCGVAVVTADDMLTPAE